METDNKEKLTLKELAGYLPHKLPARLSSTGIFNLDSEYPNENAHKWGYIDNFYFNDGEISGSIRISENYSFDFEEEDFEIGLRPLSDLTKSITHNGETFVPLIEIIKKLSLYDLSNLDFVVGLNQSDNEFWVNAESNGTVMGGGRVIDSISFDKNVFKVLDNYGRMDILKPQSKALELLDKWHFDWKYNLIGRGLAININDLPN